MSDKKLPPSVLEKIKHAAKTIFAADLYCGAGGASCGLVAAAMAIGFSVNLVAVNHWEQAIKTHSANFPGAIHMLTAVDRVDPKVAVPGGFLHMLLAGPSCFTEGTLILTKRGLVSIDRVRIGDLVLTHRGRYRRVYDVGQRITDTVIVSGKGHYGIETTPEHPFYTIKRLQRHRPKDGSRFHYTDPEWTPVEELDVDRHMWATPTTSEELPIPSVPGRGAILSEAFWWMVGRWLGDGWLRIREENRGTGAYGSNGEVAICCGSHEIEELAARLSFAEPSGLAEATSEELRWRYSATRTGGKFETYHLGLAQWLRQHFGEKAHGKTIPAWAFSMPEEWRRELLNGYISADGHDLGKQIQIATVSKSLAIGIRLLAESLGIRATIIYRPKAPKGVIEGREINQRDQYWVRWSKIPEHENFTTSEIHSWRRIREVKQGRKMVNVYSLAVEEDDSYVADGIVVHNCVHFSKARGDLPTSDQQRSGAWDIIRWCRDIYVARLLIENVEEFKTWGPLRQKRDDITGELLFDEETGEPLMEPCPHRKGMYFRQWLRMLVSMGYRVEWRVLCAADYGDATTRKRLFIQARRDGSPITWPERTHCPPELLPLFPDLKPWVPAKDIIDWSIAGENIFTRNKKMAIATLKRIYTGLEKFHGLEAVPIDPQYRVWFSDRFPTPEVEEKEPEISKKTGKKKKKSPVKVYPIPPFVMLPAADPQPGFAESFLLPNEGVHRGNAPRKISTPIPTVTQRGAGALVSASFSPSSSLRPYLVQFTQTGNKDGKGGIRSVDLPVSTLTTKQEHVVIQPYLVNLKGQSTAMSIEAPTPTLTAHARHLYLAQPFIIPQFSSQEARSIDAPLGTVTTTSRGVGLVKAKPGAISPDSFVVTLRRSGGKDGQARPRGISEPLPTICAGGQHIALCSVSTSLSPHLVKFYGKHTSASLDAPLPTVTASYEHYGLCQPGVRTGSPFALNIGGPKGMQKPHSLDDPLPTVLAQNHTGIVAAQINALAQEIAPERDAAFLVRYQGGGKGRVQSLRVPLTTQDTSNRFAFVHPRLITAYLVSYHGSDDAQLVTKPLQALRTRDRFALTEPAVLLPSKRIASTTGRRLGYSRHHLAILDIAFRMLAPRELANSHSFPADYKFIGSRADYVKMVGNSWPNGVSTALCLCMIEDLPDADRIEYLMRRPKPKMPLWKPYPEPDEDTPIVVQGALEL